MTTGGPLAWKIEQSVIDLTRCQAKLRSLKKMSELHTSPEPTAQPRPRVHSKLDFTIIVTGHDSAT
eukprot:358968-Chlamydomonas_euryale.AAC.2